jgi:hypothetical protein
MNPFENDLKCKSVIKDLVDEAIVKHTVALANLTREQLLEAFCQALACGDFQRHIRIGEHAQAVTYVPFRQVESLKAENDKLRALNLECSRLASEAAVEIQRLKGALLTPEYDH